MPLLLLLTNVSNVWQKKSVKLWLNNKRITPRTVFITTEAVAMEEVKVSKKNLWTLGGVAPTVTEMAMEDDHRHLLFKTQGLPWQQRQIDPPCLHLHLDATMTEMLHHRLPYLETRGLQQLRPWTKTITMPHLLDENRTMTVVGDLTAMKATVM